MPRYTSAYSSFVLRLGEIDILLRISFKKEKTNPVNLRNEINALCRGSVVLLSAHLEAYIKEVGELALDSMYQKRVPRTKVASRFFYHLSKQLLNEIQDTSDQEKIADKLFSFIQNDLLYWSKIGPFPQALPTEQFNKGFSNPAYDKIKAYFNRFGYTEYNRDLASVLKAKYQSSVNMIDHLVDTRNKIAHGDPTATKTPGEVKEMITIIRQYCLATDSVFAKWWRSNFCSIR
jgi:RiboL-PSP-HEPN